MSVADLVSKSVIYSKVSPLKNCKLKMSIQAPVLSSRAAERTPVSLTWIRRLYNVVVFHSFIPNLPLLKLSGFAATGIWLLRHVYPRTFSTRALLIAYWAISAVKLHKTLLTLSCCSDWLYWSLCWKKGSWVLNIAAENKLISVCEKSAVSS